jgi:hypothetical protein
VLIDADNRAKHLFGDFYVIGTDINEMKGSASSRRERSVLECAA